MAPTEKTEGQQPHEPKRPSIEIGITPDPERGIIFKREADNTLVIGGHGEFAIRMNLPHPPTLTEEQTQAAELVLSAFTTDTGSLTPDTASAPVTEQPSGSEKPKKLPPYKPEHVGGKEDKDDRYELVGIPAYDPVSWESYRQKVPFAQFDLITHPNPDDPSYTEYWHIRGTRERAEKITKQVRKGQKGVAVTVYGPKNFKEPEKTKGAKNRWKEVEGYIAGRVHVPKDQRPQAQNESQQAN